MRAAHISRRQAEASFDGLNEDVSAVQDAVARAMDVLDFAEDERSVDALLASVDEELAAAMLAADVRVMHAFADSRRAQRARRRADRSVLRALPTRLDVAEVEGEAA